MADGSLVEVDDLTFRYRRATEPAIRDLALQIERGEVLLVAGPSGCGKSTLIRALNGLIPHSYRGELTGTVRIDGRSTRELRLRDLARLVGTVLQDPRKQLVASTVRGELAFGPENLGVPPAEINETLDAVITRAEIGHLAGRTTDQLSGGESQQVAIAGTLMLLPRLVVLDEPLANLDPLAAQRLLRLVRSLADEGTAVVIVEHRVEDALLAAPDRVLYLNEGSVRYLGALDGFFGVADPASVKLPFEIAVARARERSIETRAPRMLGPSGPPAEPEVPRLEWRGVGAAYDDRTVLHDVTSRLGARQMVAVLGPNGSGKTTLFKTAIGLVPRTAGDVLVDGSSIDGSSVADLASTFGYVFQNPSQMLFARNVREELIFGPRNLGREEAGFEALIAEVLHRVGLDEEPDILERPPLTLSFGQQKRLALAVALALEPRTLVLDEPSAGQDHRTATAFMTEVERIAGLESVYFVTHDADLALTYADRILLLREGRIVADGSPLEVIADRALWLSCNLRFTSLMEANARWGGQTGRFMGTEQLADWVAGAAEIDGGTTITEERATS
ncbi:MAG: energy-coupling factor transport system ATP-binding protein [Chloroflexota bacterium]|jgi:energy-coupling factor transport system ATP-binding protein|nr:energy-coupling factor transport system ATP-binding protein [Chloroflexota bacterium]